MQHVMVTCREPGRDVRPARLPRESSFGAQESSTGRPVVRVRSGPGCEGEDESTEAALDLMSLSGARSLINEAQAGLGNLLLRIGEASRLSRRGALTPSALGAVRCGRLARLKSMQVSHFRGVS